MKILMLSDFYPPIIGGMERHVKLLSEGLSKRGHSVTVCTMNYGDLPGFEERGNVRIYRLEGFFQRIPFLFKDNRKKYPPPLPDCVLTNSLEELIEDTKPDIIHAHGWILYSALALRKKYRIPLIATVHDFGLICPKKNITKKRDGTCTRPFTISCINCGLDLYNFRKSFLAYWSIRAQRRALQNVDMFIAVSQFVKQFYSTHLRLDDTRIVVIPNFYVVEEDFDSKAEISLPKDFVLFVGALMPGKGVDLLIDAYSRLDTNTKLVLIGSKHAAYSYKSKNNIIVLENLSHENVMKACATCRFMIVPGTTPEACPTVVLEAMSFKKAVLASNLGALKEMITDGVTGLLIAPSNREELVRAISFLLENPEKAKTLGENGFRFVNRRYSLDSTVLRVERLYEEFRNRELGKVTRAISHI